MALEYKISEDNELDDTLKSCLLAVSAISKYSYKYNCANGTTRSVSCESVILADTSGALGGVVSWYAWGRAAASGLVFGPGGAVLSIARDAARGAIVGSGIHVLSNGVF